MLRQMGMLRHALLKRIHAAHCIEFASFRYIGNSYIPETIIKIMYYILLRILRESQHILF